MVIFLLPKTTPLIYDPVLETTNSFTSPSFMNYMKWTSLKVGHDNMDKNNNRSNAPERPKGYFTRYNERKGIWQYRKKYRFHDKNGIIHKTSTSWYGSLEECEAEAAYKQNSFIELEESKKFSLGVKIPERVYLKLQKKCSKLNLDIDSFVSALLTIVLYNDD